MSLGAGAGKLQPQVRGSRGWPDLNILTSPQAKEWNSIRGHFTASQEMFREGKKVILQMLITFRGFIQLMGTINVQRVSLLVLKKGWTPGIICEWDASPEATSTNVCVMEIITQEQMATLHHTIAHRSAISQTFFLLLGFIWFRQWIRAERW